MKPYAFLECNRWEPRPNLRCYKYSELSAMLEQPQELAPVIVQGDRSVLSDMGSDLIESLIFEMVNDTVFTYDDDMYLVDVRGIGTVMIVYDTTEYANRVALEFSLIE